jgi:FlaA1/EpsC-like NDP-sugar epimerase
MWPSAAWLRGPARLVGWLTGWSRRAKRLLMAATDILLIPFALWCAVALKFDTWPAGDLQVTALSLVALLFAMGAFLATGLYHSVVRFLGSSASYAILVGVVVSALAVAGCLRSMRRWRCCSWADRGSWPVTCSMPSRTMTPSR